MSQRLGHGANYLAAALRLKFAELFCRLIESVAMLVHTEVGQGLGLFAERPRHGERGRSRVVFCVDAVLSQHVRFDGRDAIQAPGKIGDGLSQVGLQFVIGLVLIEKLFAMALVSGEVVGWQDDGLVAERVK